MTRKDYVAFAKSLTNIAPSRAPETEYEKGMDQGIRAAIECITLVMAQDNPKFDYDRFIAATHIDDWKEQDDER